MKKEKKEKRKRVFVQLSQAEYDRLQKEYQSTTFNYFSEYLRSLWLTGPVVFKYRNQSADEWLAMALSLKNELIRFRYYSPELDAKIDETLLLLHKIYQLWSSTSSTS